MRWKIAITGLTAFILVLLVPYVALADSMLEWTASEGEITGYRIYGGTTQGQYTGHHEVGNVTQYPLSNLPLTEGVTYYFVVRAYNAAGESGNSNEVSWTAPDNTPPMTPQGVSVESGGSRVTWQANSESDLGEYRVYYSTSSGTYGSFTSVGTVTDYTVEGLSQGVTYYFVVSAVDTSGNESSFSGEVSSTITDIDNPNLAITSPTDQPEYASLTSSIDVSGTASDNTGITQVTWVNSAGSSGTAAGTTSWSVSDVALSPGTNMITVTATDAAGNEGTGVLNVTYTPPDTTRPSVSITSPSSTGTFETDNAGIDLGGTASDNTGITQVIWVNSAGSSGTAAGTTSWSVSDVALSPGTNMITVTATDAAGNEGSGVLNVTYTPPDAAPPEILISSPVSGGATHTSDEGRVRLSGTATDNIGVQEVRWRSSNGTAGIASGTTNWEVSGIELIEGTNTITVSAIDEAGNMAEQSIDVVYSPTDISPPTITRTKPTSWGYYFTRRRVMNLAGTATDNVGVEKIEWRTSTGQNGVAEGTTEWMITGIKLSGGWNTITITATDEEGYQSVDELSVICWSY